MKIFALVAAVLVIASSCFGAIIFERTGMSVFNAVSSMRL